MQAKLGKTPEARRQLESMLSATHKFGYRLYEFQARLALGEIELWSDARLRGLIWRLSKRMPKPRERCLSLTRRGPCNKPKRRNRYR